MGSAVFPAIIRFLQAVLVQEGPTSLWADSLRGGLEGAEQGVPSQQKCVPQHLALSPRGERRRNKL